MWWHNGLGWGGWVVMTLTMVAFWSLVVLLMIVIFRGEGGRGRRAIPPPAEPDPMRILQERFARGEIDLAEYHARQDALRASR